MNKWQSKALKLVSRKKIIRISHEEIDSAVDEYLAHGGRIVKIKMDNRPFKNIPVHNEDIYR